MPRKKTQKPAKSTDKGGPGACTIVIFGAGGDLTRRLLVPSLYNLAASGALSEDLRLVGIDLHETTPDAWTDGLRATIDASAKTAGAEGAVGRTDDRTWRRIASKPGFVAGDFTKAPLYDDLRAEIGEGNVIFYLAVAARFFGAIVERLGESGLLEETAGRFRRVIIEKPFGHDLQSAVELNATILKHAQENQIYRIDHFLGKETVQSIMAIRFANAMFEPVWRREYIDHIQITAAETVGVEARAGFYDKTGALRDMVPNHLFNLLCMVAMEAPNSLDAEAVRVEKSKVLQAIRPIGTRDCVRGQYGRGRIDDQDVPAYRAEDGVARRSMTETYVALKVEIDNWRWSGVPFYLRTGKRMRARETEIAIVFRPAPSAMFVSDHPETPAPRNVVRLMIDPEHGIRAEFAAKLPGPALKLAPVHSTFRYNDFFGNGANVGYETLVYDCLIGDPMLFQRADAIEASWRAVSRLLSSEDRPDTYPAGSQGPDAAEALLARDGRTWLHVGTLENEAHDE